jgi:hypothetical protein
MISPRIDAATCNVARAQSRPLPPNRLVRGGTRPGREGKRGEFGDLWRPCHGIALMHCVVDLIGTFPGLNSIPADRTIELASIRARRRFHGLQEGSYGGVNL